jgi:hypothetical protein
MANGNSRGKAYNFADIPGSILGELYKIRASKLDMCWVEKIGAVSRGKSVSIFLRILFIARRSDIFPALWLCEGDKLKMSEMLV